MVAGHPVRWALVVAGLALLAGSGCGGVNRRFVIESNVPNAQVYINNRPVGAAPAHAAFEYYGYYNIELVHPDFQRETRRIHVRAPWYAYPPFDFLAEVFWPFHVDDVRRYNFTLNPAVRIDTGELITQAEDLRQRGINLPPAEHPAEPKDKNPAAPGVPPVGAIPVVAFGDSITRGEGVQTDEAFASILSKRLSLTLTNSGISGDQSSGGLRRLSKDVLDKKPKIVLVMFGTNDSFVVPGANDSRLTLQQYRDNLVSMVDAIRKNGGEPILMTEPHCASTELNGLGESPNIRLAKFADVCRAVAKEKNVALVDHFQHWSDAEAKGTVLNDWMADGFHPNARGQKELADLIEPVLKQVMSGIK